MKIEQVKASFESEFSPVLEKFAVYDITLDQVKNFTADFIWRPGVYVFWNESEGVIKVGCHIEKMDIWKKRRGEYCNESAAE